MHKIQARKVSGPLAALIRLGYALFIDRENGQENKNDPELVEYIKQNFKLLGPYREYLDPELTDAMRQFAAARPKDKFNKVGDLGLAIRELAKEMYQDADITSEQLEVVKAIGLYLDRDSEPAARKLVRFASIAADSFISRQLASGHGDQDDSEIVNLVKEHMGLDTNKLSADQAKEFREQNPEAYKEYLRLRREYLQVFKDALASYVRSSGNHTVPFREIEEYMEEAGIENPLPTGFTGRIDDLGRFYTNGGELINGVPSTVTFPKILMNKTYGKPNGGSWVFMALREDGSPGPYFYTDAFKKAAVAQKFTKVQNLAPKIESMRKKWFANVRRFNPEDPKDVVSVILELLFQFSARIGSPGNKAANQPTYGISTLLVKHARATPAGDIVLSYKGKDGVNTKHTVLRSDPEQKYLVAAINDLLDGKEPNDRIFTYDKGERFYPITSTAVNQYFKSLGAKDVGVHKLRTYKGTKIFREVMEKELSKKSLPTTDKAALDLLKKMAVNVGKTLNHVRRSADGKQTVTPATAMQSYIDPAIQKEYFDRLSLRYPKYLEKLMG